MMLQSRRRRWFTLPLAIAVAAMTACNADSAVRPQAGDAALAKGGAGGGGGGGAKSISVSAASPSYGHRGDQHLIVQIDGSGFVNGATAAWERNGVADPKIHVNSTTFVSSSLLTADIDIASDADLALYDVSVTSGTKKGVGSELFTVTTAFLVPELGGGPPGASDMAWDINDAGAVVGRSNAAAFYWDASNGIEPLMGDEAFAIDEAGALIVGVFQDSKGVNQPRIWTGSPGNWVAGTLPACSSGIVVGGVARGVSHNGRLVAGHVIVSLSRKTQVVRPVLWDMAAGTCESLPLTAAPFDYSGRVYSVNDAGMAAGSTGDSQQSGRPVVWAADGTPTMLALLPGAASGAAAAIDATGSLVVGMSDRNGVYWYFDGSAWSGAIQLAPGGSSCESRANGVSDHGLIVGVNCVRGYAAMWQVTGGVAGPEMDMLKGGEMEGVNNNTGSGLVWAAGSGLGGAVYWLRP